MRDLVGIAFVDTDPRWVDAKLITQYLRKHRLVALTMRDGAEDQGHAAGLVEANLSGFVATSGRLFDRIRDANTAE